MKQFYSFVIKETRHILRDKRTMLILFGMPVVLMLLFGFAITNDVKNVRTIIVAPYLSPQAQLAVERLSASEYFTITATVPATRNAEQLIRVRVYNRDILVLSETNDEVSLFDLTGSKVDATSLLAGTETTLHAPTAGIYIVQTGQQVQKVIVQ